MDNVITRRTVMTGAAATAVVLLTGSEKSIAEQPNTHDVTIKAFKFDPEHIQVKVGDTIMWTNKDLAPHTATADEFGWDTETLTKGQTKEITVTTGMEKSYFCAFHPHMKGSIEIL